MAEVWVVNASPLIALAAVGRLELLAAPARRLVVPSAVVAEIEAGPADDPARTAVGGSWAGERPSVVLAPRVVEWGLGAGEAAVLSHVSALGEGAVAVIDDGAARACARALGIQMIGTLGIVLRAHVQGRIASASAVMRELRAAGLWIDVGVVREALARVTGERFDP